MSELAQQQIAAADGRTIIARFFGSIDRPRASVLIVPAMGVAQPYYAPFAAWFAGQGFLAVTFDYRGIGLSRAGSLRGFDADIFDWARLDCAAMIETLTARVSGKPLYWIGHSLGGQIIPFVPNWNRAARIITLWYAVVPLSVRLFGYFPGKRLRAVGDLPGGSSTNGAAGVCTPNMRAPKERTRSMRRFARRSCRCPSPTMNSCRPAG